MHVWTFAGEQISSPLFSFLFFPFSLLLFDGKQTCRDKVLQGIIRLFLSGTNIVPALFGEHSIIPPVLIDKALLGVDPIGILLSYRWPRLCFNVAFALDLALHEANGGAGHRSGNPYHHCLCALSYQAVFIFLFASAGRKYFDSEP